MGGNFKFRTNSGIIYQYGELDTSQHHNSAIYVYGERTTSFSNLFTICFKVEIFINITFWTALVRSVAREYEDIIYTKLKWVSLAIGAIQLGIEWMCGWECKCEFCAAATQLKYKLCAIRWWMSENAIRSNEWTNLIVLKFKWCIRIQIYVTHTHTHFQPDDAWNAFELDLMERREIHLFFITMRDCISVAVDAVTLLHR